METNETRPSNLELFRDGKVQYPDQPIILSDTTLFLLERGTSWPTPIPVSERLPESGVMVLAWNDPDPRHGSNDPFAGWYLAYYSPEDGSWTQEQTGPHAEYNELELITHWLPLPPSPNVATQSQPEPRE